MKSRPDGGLHVAEGSQRDIPGRKRRNRTDGDSGESGKGDHARSMEHVKVLSRSLFPVRAESAADYRQYLTARINVAAQTYPAA